MACRKRLAWLIARRATSCAVALATLAVQVRTQAQSPNLRVEGCTDFDEGALADLLQIEFRTLGLSAHDVRIDIRCEGLTANIRLEQPDGSAFPLELRVDMRSTAPSARPRLLALAASELATQVRRTELLPLSPAPVHAPAAPASSPARSPEAPPAPEQPSMRIMAGATLRRAGSPGTWLGGAEFGGELRIAGPLWLALGGRLERGTTSTSLAQVGWSGLSGSIGMLVASGAGRFGWATGGGMSGGHLTLEPRNTAPNEGRELSGLWLGPSLLARSTLDLGANVAVLATLQAGWIALPIRGTIDNGPTLVAAEGLWTGAMIGLGYSR